MLLRNQRSLGSISSLYGRSPSQSPDDPDAWRFRLENPSTGRHNGYAGMEALLKALPGEIMGEGASGDGNVKSELHQPILLEAVSCNSSTYCFCVKKGEAHV